MVRSQLRPTADRVAPPQAVADDPDESAPPVQTSHPFDG
jgi:hypothetical protein